MTTKTQEFSSENHKLEVSNLPNKIKYYAAKQIFENYYKLTPHKIKLGNNRAYIAFKTEDEKNDAMLKINQQHWKDRILIAKPAAAKSSPFLRKDSDKDREQNQPTDDDINYKVCPLYNKNYDEQIKIKNSLMLKVLNFQKKDQNLSSMNICCEFLGVVPSPVINKYRNKCEFNFDQTGTIGFKMGRYRDGSERVVSPPSNCPLINEKMFEILILFQSFMKNEKRKTKLLGYNHITRTGNLRQLTIRTNEMKQCLIIVDAHPQDLSEDELKAEIDNIIELLKYIDGVISIYINISDKDHFTTADQTMRLVYGQSHLNECLKITNDDSPPLKFRIGPNSFFQVNTKAAELLYRTIIDIAQLDSDSLVLDMGCGTGTISLSIAKQVFQVIGVEVIKSAIEDAKVNAKENNITNAIFFCGRAEDLIDETIKIMKSMQNEQKLKGEIVAIVDPPRAGFNNSFIKTLRATSNIKKIVYVACDPEANTNLISLCKPTSKAYQGEPFIPTRAKAFDLFPYTRHCELVLLYERLSTEHQSFGQKS